MLVIRILATIVLVTAATAAFAGGRIALVIGNSNYAHAARLVNPSNDAVSIALMLKQGDFDRVDIATDLKQADFLRKLNDFEIQAEQSDVAVIYYSGHGIEEGGENFLVPVDAVLARDKDVEDETVPLNRILQAVSGAKRLKLVILDACRNNPFVAAMQRTSATRAVGDRGLARIEPYQPDTLVAYAAKAGTTASDGGGENSPFTTALLNHLTEPNLDIRFALGRVRDEVIRVTEGTESPQEPFVYGSLGGAEIPLVTKTSSSSTAAINDVASSEAAWDMVQDSASMGALFRFVDRFPTSPHRTEALQRALELENRSSTGNAKPHDQRFQAKVDPSPPPVKSPIPAPVLPLPSPAPAQAAPAPVPVVQAKPVRRRPVTEPKPVRQVVKLRPPPTRTERKVASRRRPSLWRAEAPDRSYTSMPAPVVTSHSNISDGRQDTYSTYHP